jgi:hypothetical protein
VTKYLREARITHADATSWLEATSPHFNKSNESILWALEELPFHSLQFDSSPEPHTFQPPWSPGAIWETWVCRASSSLGATSSVRGSEGSTHPIFPVHFGDTAHLTSQDLAGYCDPEWVMVRFHYTSRTHMVSASRKSSRSGTCHDSVQKMTRMIVWGPTGFSVVMTLESGYKFNAGYYVNKVVIPLSKWWRERENGTFRKLMVHADDGRSEKSGIPQ